jgi:hypothetical protein
MRILSTLKDAPDAHAHLMPGMAMTFDVPSIRQYG